MFEENDDSFFEKSIHEHVEKFEAFLANEAFYFFDSEDLEMLLDHYLINADYTKAIRVAEYGLEYYPLNKLFVLRLAQSYSAKGELKEALGLLNSIENFQEYIVEYYLTKASIFSQLKNSDNAIKFFKMALEYTSRDERDEIYMDIATEYQYKGEYRAAIAILEEAIKVNPKNEVALYELAYCYDFIGEFDKAIESYHNFINSDPYSFTAWYNLGNIYSKVEDWKRAIDAYEFSIAIDDDFTLAYFNLGNAYLSTDAYEKAEACFLKCIQHDKDDAYSYCYLGECYEQQNRISDARLCYEKALEIFPNLADAWLGLGILYDLEDNTQKGIPLLEKAIEIDPMNPSYYHVLASANEKIGELELAEIFYLKAMAIYPAHEDLIKDYYSMLTMSEDWATAADFLEDVEEIESNHFIVNLLRFHWHWHNLNQDVALGYLGLCILEDIEKSRDIFDWFEEFKSEPVVISLFENR